MSEVKRDPRLDPHPGDVLRSGDMLKGVYFGIVDRSWKGDVSYAMQGSPLWMPLAEWQRVSANMEVIHVAE